MVNKISKYIILPLFLVAMFLIPTKVYAADSGNSDFLGFPSLFRGIKGVTQGQLDKGKDPGEIIVAVGFNVADIISRALVIVALGMLIYGGVKYMTSTGEPGKVKEAQSTIIKSIIGLIICVSTSAIISFVIQHIS